MASSSSSSSPSPPPVDCPHDVFLSFRGEDVRLKFRSHFLKELDRKLITFKDDEMEKGRSITPELIKAIKGSRISIIAFSKNFPSSSWCLDELVEIVKCREERGLIVIPIFYEVDPSHVKKQSDDFGVIFDKTCEGRSEDQILGWRLALTSAATVVGDGEDSRNWTDEAKMFSQGTEDVFGISFNVAEMEETLRRDERFKGLKKLQFMRMCKESLYGKEVRLHLVKGLHSLRHRLNNT